MAVDQDDVDSLQVGQTFPYVVVAGDAVWKQFQGLGKRGVQGTQQGQSCHPDALHVV